MIRRIQSLRGLRVAALDGDAGRISDIYFDDATWRVRYLVADTGWLTGIHALIPPRLVLGVDERLHQVDVNMTRLQIERSPTPDSELPAYAQLQGMEYTHLATMYLGFGDPTPAIPARSFNPHIRSAHHLAGFHVSATDGDLGLVIDLLVEDTDWTIPYLLADSRHWRMGRPRLVPRAASSRSSSRSRWFAPACLARNWPLRRACPSPLLNRTCRMLPSSTAGAETTPGNSTGSFAGFGLVAAW